MQRLSHKQSTWLVAVSAIVGSVYFAWTAVAAMRTGTIDVQRSFMGFVRLDVVNSDDQPVQFWFAVIGHWIVAAACVVGLVVFLKLQLS